MTGVLLAAAMFLGSAASGGADSGPVVQMQYSNPGLIPAQWTLVIHPDGSGHFTSERGGAPREKGGGLEPANIDRDVQLTPQFAQSVFQVARRKKLFQQPCDSQLKVAFQGMKTLTYSGPDGHGSCAFNYSKDVEIQGLGESLVSVAATLIEGERLEMLMRHDPLGLDRETATLVEMAEDRRAQQLGLIRPILKRLAGNEEVLQRVRRRATDLLSQSGD